MKTPAKVTLIAIAAVIALVIGAIVYTATTRPKRPQTTTPLAHSRARAATPTC